MQASPFRATSFEYKFRFILHGIIYALGFWAPWNYALHADEQSTTREAIFTLLGVHVSLSKELQFFYLITAIAVLLTGLGAFFRTWGTAYVSTGVVGSRQMHGDALLADGPYRRTRNPLYLGTLLHSIGLAILMPPTGAIVSIVLIWVLQIRLALAEEPFLAARFGQPYLDYAARVPRFLPTFSPLVPAAGAKPQWPQAFLGEFYFTGVCIVLAIFGWSLNATPAYQGIIVSFGLWIILRALLPQTKKA